MSCLENILPYLVPGAHCLFYSVHMVQEHVFDIYKYDDDAVKYYSYS